MALPEENRKYTYNEYLTRTNDELPTAYKCGGLELA
jgi:hypothetical protein